MKDDISEVITFISELTPETQVFLLAIGAVAVSALALYTVIVTTKNRED